MIALFMVVPLYASAYLPRAAESKARRFQDESRVRRPDFRRTRGHADRIQTGEARFTMLFQVILEWHNSCSSITQPPDVELTGWKTMGEPSAMPGELIYEQAVRIKQVNGYGVALETLLSGAAAPPAEGARFDIHIEGIATGPKLKGTVKGVDCINVRADGRLELHFHAEITTDDGKRIRLAANGVVTAKPRSPVAPLRANITLTTSAAEYSWVNRIQVWASGIVDFANSEIRFKAYAV